MRQPDPVLRRNRRKEKMPTYEFVCKKCKKEFTLVLRLKEYEKGGFSCPKCKSKEVEQKISVFQTKTSKKS